LALAFTVDNFKTEVLASEHPVLVDFTATWCGPCQQLAPVIDSLAEKYDGKAKVGKVDVDSNQGTAARYQVRGIPTLLVFKGGQVVDQVVGAVSKEKLTDMLQTQLG